MKFPDKDPGDVLDYTFNWTKVLETGEAISSATVTATQGLTVDSFSESSGIVTAWLSGGTAGESYSVTCTIVTDSSPNPRTIERSRTVRVREL